MSRRDRLCLFFFKQKTAYEMRISDWSSDVCSSDLLEERPMIAGLVKAVAGEDLATLTPQRVNELRASYFASARDFGWDDKRRLVDKDRKSTRLNSSH